eukprot:CAMPEP_0114359896 /NCGR_PEP_ID=MMETSP0101-20121206/23386_1 /TAXON_ID=38822 ORGANISM="Pteridomonas danica, Strain PT" /NCGR_SAMPLE_ID=MMETSP0101 /ASSEMBLY_ACC=CAM_ASM_000211 /LENGTH=124 /DNA_ID=CAMNT_0001503719 /DNA_START=8 /DNA_END=382 /DNA_ORIENTATION=-
MASTDEAEVYHAAIGGGKLSLKGIEFKKKKKSKKSKRKREMEETPHIEERTERASDSDSEQVNPEDMLTDAQKRYQKKMRERASETARKEVQITHRMKVEMFNHRLASLSEHNDIPRISAAGNG